MLLGSLNYLPNLMKALLLKQVHLQYDIVYSLIGKSKVGLIFITSC